jgi:hypothetical protein
MKKNRPTLDFLAKNAKSQKTTNPNIGFWVPKDADFYVDFKNINYFSENCIYQKFFQYNIKCSIVDPDPDFREWVRIRIIQNCCHVGEL